MNKTNQLEEEVLTSYNKDKWQSVHQVQQEMTRYASYAQPALIKDKFVTGRLKEAAPR